MAKRVQMRRDRPWRRDYPDAVIVARPGRWGNPYRADEVGGRAAAVALFEAQVAPGLPVEELRGRDLACWCPLDAPCHADVLLRLANGSDPREE